MHQTGLDLSTGKKSFTSITLRQFSVSTKLLSAMYKLWQQMYFPTNIHSLKNVFLTISFVKIQLFILTKCRVFRYFKLLQFLPCYVTKKREIKWLIFTFYQHLIFFWPNGINYRELIRY